MASKNFMDFEKAIEYMDPMQMTDYLHKTLDFLQSNNNEIYFPAISPYVEAFLVNLVSDNRNLMSKTFKCEDRKLALEIIEFLEMSRDVFRWAHSYENGNLLVYKKIFSNKIKNMILQQRERLHNLEISGVPENNAENLSVLMSNIAKTAGVELTPANILHVNRVQPRVEVAGRPRNIVVQLNSALIKKSILSGICRHKGITTSDIGMPGEPHNIYINEHLIPFYKQLRKATKNAADAASYKYVWVRDCKIFARKSDNSAIIHVKDASDLIKIK